jgi:hypothetical protein
MPKDMTTIKVTKQLARQLNSLKVVPRETYDTVIIRLIRLQMEQGGEDNTNSPTAHNIQQENTDYYDQER